MKKRKEYYLIHGSNNPPKYYQFFTQRGNLSEMNIGLKALNKYVNTIRGEKNGIYKIYFVIRTYIHNDIYKDVIYVCNGKVYKQNAIYKGTCQISKYSVNY